MPLKSALSPSNTNTQYKKNIRSESEIPPTNQTAIDTKVRSQTDIRSSFPFDSGIVMIYYLYFVEDI